MIYYNQFGIVKDRNLSEFVAIKHIRQKLIDFFNDKEYLSMRNYIQHGTTNCILHSIAVTHYSAMFAHRMHIKINYKDLIIGALLHDYFLYDWHVPDKSHRLHGFTHAGQALMNAEKDFILGQIERDMIKRHMFPLNPIPPRYRESLILCVADKICALQETVEGRMG